MSSSLAEDIQAQLRMRLAEQEQLEKEAVRIEAFMETIRHDIANMELMSSSARNARGLRNRYITMTPQEELAQYEQDLENIRQRIEALQDAIELLEQQL
ncbi:hypothetical protein H109_00999 [Trichophyton interdigitale MR816]|uniref:Uncharacterized protein n=1 Tax=Trichophyton interdigitale (strain MR816) TaxID=1215338 RepID=A0A059JH91_TRIIM|nr:hypothetical protein H109_00999 [Trichophyton interdigitale MR816]